MRRAACSGKSALLAGLAREATLVNGRMALAPRCAVVTAPQRPWFFGGSVADNLCSALPRVEDRLEQALEDAGVAGAPRGGGGSKHRRTLRLTPSSRAAVSCHRARLG